MLKSPLWQTTIKQVCVLVRHEVHQLCSQKSGDSSFRFSHVAALQSFSWKPLLKELFKNAPSLYAILKAALSSQKKEYLRKRNTG